MYLHIGANGLVPISELIAIIARKGSNVRNNKRIDLFLEKSMEYGEVVDLAALGNETAKSIIVADHGKVYISPISPQTLYTRNKKNGISEGLNEIDG